MNVENRFPNLYMMIRCWGVGDVDTDKPLNEKVRNWMEGGDRKWFDQVRKETALAISLANDCFEDFGNQTQVLWFKNSHMFVEWMTKLDAELERLSPPQ
ncbi:MAG: hypothetical protein R3C53_28895 [Pirellulaceae bacterium]